MKILVLSDSHGAMRGMCAAAEKENPDFILHLGDHICDAYRLAQLYPHIALCCVPGNCDYGASGLNPNHLEEFAGVRVFMTHGHVYGVKAGLLRAELAAREAQAQVLVFGHTHRAFCEEKRGLWIMNPGTCMGSLEPSYGIILVENGKTVCYTVTEFAKEEEHHAVDN